MTVVCPRLPGVSDRVSDRVGRASGKSESLVELMGLMPTLFDLCGLSIPEGVEGSSLAQELALAIRAFSFYVEVEDKKAAHDMLKRIEVSGSEALAKGSRETYDIFLCGSSACVDEMEGALKGARQAEELRLCQLLAIQYENREDEVRAKEHQARAEKVLEDALK